MNIPNVALGPLSSTLNRNADDASTLFDPPVDARQNMKLWRQARRARQEWREQRYARLLKG